MSVLVLDDSDDLRQSLSEVMSDLWSARCLALASVAELEARAGEVLDCDVALLDVNLGAGKPSGIDAYRWLREHAFPGRIVFLTGHATTNPDVIAARSHGQTVLEKPIDIAKLGALVAGARGR